MSSSLTATAFVVVLVSLTAAVWLTQALRGIDIMTGRGQTVFVFDFHGGECGGFGSQACPGEFAWDPAAKGLTLLPTPALHTAVEDPVVFDR